MMVALPKIGESLDPGSTLAAKARGVKPGEEVCSICKQSPYPRGFFVNLGICWTCRFP